MRESTFLQTEASVESNSFSRKTKISLLITLLSPILVCDTEIWAVVYTNVTIFGVFYRKILIVQPGLALW